MAKRQSEAVAASLLTAWTDADTAMQIVGTSIGVFGESPLDPTVVLASETPLRNALFDVLLSLVEGGAVEMQTTGDDRYAFRWRNDVAVAGLTPNGSSSIDLAVPSPYVAELQRANAERDAALQRAEAAETLAAEREHQLQRVAEVARASEAPAAKPPVRTPAPKKVAPKQAEPLEIETVKPEPVPAAAAPVNAEPAKAEPAKTPRKPAAKKSAPKKAPGRKAGAEKHDVLRLPPPEAGAEPDIDLTAENTAPELRPAQRPKWAGYAIDRSRKHLTSVDTIAEDG